MIQPFFNSMITLLLAKFVLNDLPHAAKLFEPASNSGVRASKPTVSGASREKVLPLAPLAERKNIWITGSVAVGRATAESDIDIIVELTGRQFRDVAVARRIEDEVLSLTSEAEVYFAEAGNRFEVWQLSRPNRDGLIGAPGVLWRDARPIKDFFSGMTEWEKWEAMMASIRRAAKILNIDLTEQDMPEYLNWYAGRTMHKELWAQVYARTGKTESYYAC